MLLIHGGESCHVSAGLQAVQGRRPGLTLVFPDYPLRPSLVRSGVCRSGSLAFVSALP